MPYIFWNHHVTGVEWTFDERFDTPEACGFVNHGQAAHESECGFVSTFDDKTDHARALWHDPLSDFIIIMGFERSVVDAFNHGMCFKPFSERCSVAAKGRHSNVKGAHPSL